MVANLDRKHADRWLTKLQALGREAS
jgi:hypothetical protein